MPRTLSKQLVISQADGTLQHRYEILENDKNELQWFEGSESEDTVQAGQPVVHKWGFFGGGACETVDMGKGGYFFSTNCTVCNPWRIRPRPETTSVTLNGNTVPVERFFEADDGTNKYLYCLAGAKSFKIKNLTATPALAEAKTFTAVGTTFAQGSYAGDGQASHEISGVGFTPAVVIVKGEDATYAIIKTANVPDNKSKDWANAFITTGITSLAAPANGFTVGNHATVNSNGVKYYWYAWKAEAGLVATGTYTGDGADDRDISGVGFKPALVHIFRDEASFIQSRFSNMGSDASYSLMTASAYSDAIQDFHNDGFEIGTYVGVNTAATTYYWVALREITALLVIGTYVGNGENGRPINGIGFQPIYIIIKGAANVTASEKGVHRGTEHTGDSSQYFDDEADLADCIESLDSNGFTVGSHDLVNRNATVYSFAAFGAGGGTPQVGKPAEWVSKWRVPMGKAADAETLTTVYDESAGGDDTWTTNYGLAAQHFQAKGNTLARAHQDRKVSLCSANDITNLDNWGAPYSVGPPDTVITDLVEWKAELAIPTTDGMYMFDGVATSRQQLPLLGGIKDADNGKNSLNWMGQVLVPTKGGLLRWSYGTAAPKGPDSIFGYVEAEGVSNEPIHLQHFGLTYLEDWIYEAVYDGTNYHIIYGRPFGEGFRWDFLLTSSSIIKTLFVDSNACLWYGLGNNLSSIQLRRSGAPTGGNYGEASLTGSFYTSEKVLAEGANVRCRMAKVETDNNQTTLTWKLYSIRDGATAEQVGAAAGFKTDGEQKLYWTAASNLKARRLRYRLDFACSSFVPETTPPECLSLEFHGETLPDKAKVIRVVVSLDSEGRSNKTVEDELAAHENAGVRRVRSPITDEVFDVVIFGRETVKVKQRGAEPPKVGIMLHLRCGDVA